MTTAPAVPQVGEKDPLRWKAMIFIGISQLMVVLDASIVNLALPSAKRALGISDANQQWVITAYTLTFGGLLLLGGRIADYMGRKRAFLIGLIGFAVASLLGGIAPTAGVLFAARALQGAFAALLAPAALSLVSVIFTDPRERAKAFGIFGAIAGGGAAIGLLLGVNTPISIIAALGAIRFIRESKAPGNTSYDVPGAITVTLGLVSLVYGLTKAAPKPGDISAHWTEPATLAFLVTGVVLLIAFVLIELRTSNPLLPMRVALERNRGGAYLSSLITGAGLFSMFLFLGLYLQVIKGFSPIRAGFAFLPFSIGIILTAGVASYLLPKLGPRPLMVPGLLMAASGLYWLTFLKYDSAYLTHVLPAMLLMSVGMAFVFIPTASTALHGVGHHDAGVASALINASQQVGGSIGAALLNTVAVTVSASYIASHLPPTTTTQYEALTAGYTKAFMVSTGLMLLAAVVVLALIRIGKESLQEQDDDVPVHLG
jgi:EmrB/QacA subfamily drug resistance transporter